MTASSRAAKLRTGWSRRSGQAIYHFAEHEGRGSHTSACGREFVPGRGLRHGMGRRYPLDCPECWRVIADRSVESPPLKEFGGTGP